MCDVTGQSDWSLASDHDTVSDLSLFPGSRRAAGTTFQSYVCVWGLILLRELLCDLEQVMFLPISRLVLKRLLAQGSDIPLGCSSCLQSLCRRLN